MYWYDQLLHCLREIVDELIDISDDNSESEDQAAWSTDVKKRSISRKRSIIMSKIGTFLRILVIAINPLTVIGKYSSTRAAIA